MNTPPGKTLLLGRPRGDKPSSDGLLHTDVSHTNVGFRGGLKCRPDVYIHFFCEEAVPLVSVKPESM